jgi:hypothetical protein
MILSHTHAGRVRLSTKTMIEHAKGSTLAQQPHHLRYHYLLFQILEQLLRSFLARC